MADRNPEIVTWTLPEPHKGWMAMRRGAKYAYGGATEEEALANLQRAEGPADRNPDPVEVIARIHAHNCGLADEPQAWEKAGIYQSAREEIDALESAGLRIVSLEPTEEMVFEFVRHQPAREEGEHIDAYAKRRLAAALAAAPKRGDQTDQ